MLAKMTAAAKTAGDATARAAKQGKLNTEIVMLKNKLAKAKHDFGPLVYEAMVASINGPEVDRLFNETRQKVEAIQAEIDAKRAEVESRRARLPQRSGQHHSHPCEGKRRR